MVIRFCFALFLFTAVPLHAQVIDFIVALVDDEVILHSEFAEYKKIARFDQDTQSLSDSELLESLLIRRIQLLRARQSGIRISDERLNQMLVENAKIQGISPERMLQESTQFPGGTSAYKSYFRENITIQELQRIAIRSSIDVTEHEARLFLASEQGRQVSRLVYRIAFLSVPEASTDTDSEQSKIYTALRTTLALDEDFTSILRKVKQQYPQVDGKLLEAKHINSVPTAFAEVAPLLHDKQVSQPFSYQGKTYLIKVTEVRGSEPQNQQQVLLRHILLKPSVIRNKEQTRLFLNQLRERIINGESFTNIAQTYTEDLSTKSNGGQLEWRAYTQFAPAFAEVARQTAVNTVSQVFQSVHGLHIMQVRARREQDISEQLEIDRVRNYLFQQKVDDELPRWLNQLRESVYVEIKDTSLLATAE